jgi:hypothetical protein
LKQYAEWLATDVWAALPLGGMIQVRRFQFWCGVLEVLPFSILARIFEACDSGVSRQNVGRFRFCICVTGA